MSIRFQIIVLRLLILLVRKHMGYEPDEQATYALLNDAEGVASQFQRAARQKGK